MQDILDLIISRRTITSFEPKFVSWEKIARVLDAGRHAPCCGNLQNWKFILVYDSEQKGKLAEALYEHYEVTGAWALVVICGETAKAERYYGEKGKWFTAQNCAAAAENMILEAHSLGLGTRWIGAFDEEVVKSLLGVPEEVSVQVILALGYAKEIPEKPPKFPLEVVTYFGGWRRKMKDPAKYMNDIASILARKAQAIHTAAQKLVSKS